MALLLSPAALLPVSLAVVLLVSLVPAVLLVLGPLAFLVLLLPSEAGVLAFMVVRVTFTAATVPMPGTLRQTYGYGRLGYADGYGSWRGRYWAPYGVYAYSNSNSSHCEYTYKYSNRLHAYRRVLVCSEE